MRTLKKTLCLVLALVMMLGLCAVSASATAFTDDDEIAAEYQEAVEVVSAIGVINGKGDGSTFDPKGTLTRAQGSYLITYLLKADTGATATRFTDVNLEDVAVIEWMAANNIADGRDETTFDPYSTMKGMEFAKWLLTALGYDAERENLTGPYWEGGVRILTAKVGLAAGIDNYDQNAEITREQAAQMCLNALEKDMVEYPIGIGQGGMQVNFAATPVGNGTGKDYRKGNSNATMQLCEMFYPQLTKDEKNANNTSTEDLNRPLESIWSYKGAELYRVQSAPLKVYTDAVKADDLTKELSDYYIKAADSSEMYVNSFNWISKTSKTGATEGFKIFVNGAAVDEVQADHVTITNGSTVATDGTGSSIAALIAKLTGKGRVVEIYTDDEDDPYRITQINVSCYTVAEITDLTTDKGVTTYSVKAGDTTITAKNYADSPKQNQLITDDALAKNDIVLVTSNDANNLADPTGSVKLYAYAAEKRTGTQSSFTNTSSKKQITVDGTTYDIATAVANDETYTGNLLEISDFNDNNSKEINFYLDAFGYVVYAKEVKKSDTTSGNYAFIVAASGYVATDGLKKGEPTVEVRAVLSDGSWGEYTVKTELVKYSGTTKVNGENKDNNAIDRYYPSNGTTYAKTDFAGTNSGDKFAVDYYIISGTDIILAPTGTADGAGAAGPITFVANSTADGINVNNAAKLLMSDIYGYVYEYELKDGVLTLKPIGNSANESQDDRYGDNYVDGTKKDGKTYTGQTTTEVVKSVLSYKTASNATGTASQYAAPSATAAGTASTNTLVVNESTKFVLFDSAKQKVTVETGLSNLPSATNGAVGYYVATGTKSATRMNATVVFCTKTAEFKPSTAGTDTIVFVNVSKDRGETAVENGSKSVTTFSAWTLDGDRLNVTWEGEPSSIGSTLKTGLYKINEKNELGDCVLDEDDSAAITVNNPYFYEANSGDDAYLADQDAIMSTATTETDAGGNSNNLWKLNGKKPVNGGDITKDKLYVVVRTSGSDVLSEVAYVFTVS